MDSSKNPAGGRRQLQIKGPRPSPLSVHKIKKPPPRPPPHPHPHPQQQQAHQQPDCRQPPIIYSLSPKVVHTNVDDFMTVVQRLTGLTSGDFSNAGDVSPAARLASTEKTNPSAEREKFDDLMDLVEGVEFGQLPGILSPAPPPLTPVLAGYFSPQSDSIITREESMERLQKVKLHKQPEGFIPIEWEVFSRNVGEVVLSSSIQQIAARIVQECKGHHLAIMLMARSLKNVTDVNFWELALHKLSMLPSSQIEGIGKAIINAMAFIWEAMDNIAKVRVKHCTLYPKGEWIDKSSLISHWIKDHLVYSHDEGHFVLQSLTNAYLVEDCMVNHVRLKEKIYDVLVNLLVPKMYPMFLKQGDFEKTESMKEEEWNGKEIYLMDDELYELPESPNCPSLIALYLQRNYDLTIIPPLFFDHMPVLLVLDLSHTSIKSLPESLPKLVALRKLVLRGCELFMELSPQVGELNNLEELDLEETQIIYLPVEIGKLVKLKRLRASFYGDMNCSKKRLQSSTMIHTGVISNLIHLNELSIDVNPDDERWNATVEAIIEEVCSSKMLNTLSLYLPKFELLKKLGGLSLIYHPLSRFSFVVGHPKRRIISRVPDEVEARFKEWDKCLKFVNGRDIPDEIKEVLRYATAFYLEHNATAVTLSEFGIENMRKLKFCILAEFNKMQTIIDGGELYEERSDREEEGDQTEEVLGSLLYLGIYYMNNLRSISKGPIHKGCLLNLKLLRIHTCPRLSTIFSVDFLANLNNLEVLIVEDCPQVTCIVSQASSHPASVSYLPSLRRILLLFLPELVSISSGLHIAPKLERIGFYYCPKLESLSTTELSSENLKVIKGERKWWDEALKWNESDWGCRPDQLNNIFCEIDEEKDLMTQLTEDGYFFHASEQVGVEGSGGWQRPRLHIDARKASLEKYRMRRASLVRRESTSSSLFVTSMEHKGSPVEQLPIVTSQPKGSPVEQLPIVTLNL